MLHLVLPNMSARSIMASGIRKSIQDGSRDREIRQRNTHREVVITNNNFTLPYCVAGSSFM